MIDESLPPEELLAISASVPEALDLKPPERLVANPSGVLGLFRLSARLAAHLDEAGLSEETLDAAIQLARADGGSLLLLDESRRDLFIAAARGLARKVVASTRVSLGEGVVGWVAVNRQPILLNGNIDPRRFPKFFPKPTEIGGVICTPILLPPVGNQPPIPTGVLCVHRRVGNSPLTDNELGLVSGLSLYVGAAFQNARLFSKLNQRATQFQNMMEISRSLTASLDRDTVLRSIVEKAVELLRSQAGSLLLLDEDTNELVFKVALGPNSEKLIGTRLPYGVGIVGAVMRERKPLIVNDAKADPRHYYKIDESTALTTQSLLCVPLISQERTLGVIEVMNKKDGTHFDDEDRDALAAFALQAVIALDNARLYSDLRRAFTETVRAMTNAVEARDPYTAGHTSRVTQLALETARELGWTRERLQFLEIGALTHDIGKIGVPDAILRKPRGLTEDEYAQIKAHPVAGANMLMGIETLQPLLPYILYHQERYDGTGYPFGLKGQEIPVEARLIAVVDAFDAMTSTRPYRLAMDVDVALAEIEKNSGTQFDPEIVTTLLRVLKRERSDQRE